MVIWHKHVIGRHTGPGEVGSGGGDDGDDNDDGDDDDDNDNIDDDCVDKNLEPGDLHPRHLGQQEPHPVQGEMKSYEDIDDDNDKDKYRYKYKDKDNCYTFAVF